MSAPLVSVIIPTYNHGTFVGAAVESALDQSYPNVEVIVIDDGSTDDTAAQLGRFGERIRYVWQANGERASARNHGLSLARGEYVSFLDSDDAYGREKIERQWARLEGEQQLGLVACGSTVVDELGAVLSVTAPWQTAPRLDLATILLASPLSVHTVLVRRRWLDRVGGFDGDVIPAEDWDLWLRLAAAGCAMDWVRESLCLRRIHAANTIANPRRHTAAALRVLDKFFASDTAENARGARVGAYRNVLLGGAAREYAAGQADAAREHVRAALELEPALLDDGAAGLRDGLLTHLGNRAIVADGQAYVRTMVAGLPPEVGTHVRWRRQALALAAMKDFYAALRRGERMRAWSAWCRAAVQDPSWIANRGVWSALVRSAVSGRTGGLGQAN
jgi:glycosyltransferase involved in cell wall biosynthesis